MSAHRHAKPPMTNDQNLERINEGEDGVGQNLAYDQLPRADGGNDELFDGAALAFTNNRRGSEQGGDKVQDHADHPGDVKVGGDQVGVVPDLGAHIQGWGKCSLPACEGGLF